MAGIKEYNIDIDVNGSLKLLTVPNSTGTLVTYDSATKIIGTRTNAQIIADLGLQGGLSSGLHTTVASNQVNVAFDVATYVKDKGGNDRLLFGNIQTTDTVIKMGATAGDFSVRTKADGIMFRINGSSNVPYFPLMPNAQTITTSNLAIFDAGNGLWKHQLTIADLITTGNIAGYIPPAQNLSLGTQTGQVDISGGGTSVRLTSLYPNSSVNDWNVNPLSSSGLFVINNNIGSANYPTADAGGGIGYFRGANPQGAFQIWTPTTNTDKVYLRTGATTTTWNTPKIIATEEWIATQNFVTNVTGGYLEKNTLSLSPIANWDTLAENRIVRASSNTVTPFNGYGIGFNFYDPQNSNYKAQLYLRTEGANVNINSLQYRAGNASGWSSVRTVWDDNNFNPNNYVLKSGDTMTGALNFSGITGVINHGGTNKIALNTNELVLGGGATAWNSGGIVLRPNVIGSPTGQWLLRSSGNLEMPNDGSGYIARTTGNTRTFNKVYQGINGTSVTTGILSLKFPQLTASNTMFDVTIKFYGYSSLSASTSLAELRVSFYKQSSTINATAGLRAYLIKTSNFPSEIVNVGIDANGLISINIGETTTSWLTYQSFEVERVETKFTGYNQDWGSGWTHSFETDTSTYLILRPTIVEVIKSADGNYVSLDSSKSNTILAILTDYNNIITSNAISYASSGTANTPASQAGFTWSAYLQAGNHGFKIHGGINGEDNLFYSRVLGGVNGANFQVASREWANGTFALAGSLGSYLPLAGGTMTGDINFNNSGLGLSKSGDKRIQLRSLDTVISAQATGTTSGIILRPQGSSINDGAVTIQGNGTILTQNHGNSSQWRYEDYGLGRYVSLGNIGATGLDTTANNTGFYLAGGIDTNIVGTANVKLLNFGNSSISTVQGQLVMSHGTTTNRLAFRGQQANAFSEILHSDNYTTYVNTLLGNYLPLNSNQLGQAGGISTDVNLQTNSIVYAGSSAPNRPSNTNATIFSMRGLANYGGQIATRSGLWWLRNQENGVYGNWETVATREWADGKFALSSSVVTVNDGLLTLATGTGLTGGVTFSANQAGAANFTVGIDSGYVLPTTAQVTAWNAKGNGTVTSITAGNGMTFTTITATGAVTMGTPSSIGLSTTNGLTTNSHTHALDTATITAINQGVTANGWGNHAGLYVPLGRTITINGTAFDLSADRTWTIPDTDTITRLRGTATGTYTSGDLTLLAGTNVTISQTGANFTINATNTVYTAGTGISIASNVITNSAPNATHTGDVTGATALTIANSAVTNAKMANMTANTFKGRLSTTGAPQDLTVAQMQTALGINTYSGSASIIQVGNTFERAAFTGGEVTASQNSNSLSLTITGVTAGTYNNVTVDTKGRVTAGTNEPYQTATQVSNTIAPFVDGVSFNQVSSTTPVNIPITKKKTIINITNPILGVDIQVANGLYEGYELALNGCGEWNGTLKGNVQNSCGTQNIVPIAGNIRFWWSATMNRWLQA